MRSWGTSWLGSAFERAGLCLWRSDPVSVLQHHLSDRRGLAAAGSSRGRSLGSAGPAVGPAGAGDRLVDAGAGRRPAGRLPPGDCRASATRLGLAWSRVAIERKGTGRDPAGRRSRLWLSLAAGGRSRWSLWCGADAGTAAVAARRCAGPADRRLRSRWMPWVPLGVTIALGAGRRSVSSSTGAARVALSAGDHVAGPGRLGRPGDARSRPPSSCRSSSSPSRQPAPAEARTTCISSVSSRSDWSSSPGPTSWALRSSGNNYWGDVIRTPGGRPRAWVPSLYLGGLTLRWP